MNDDNHPHNTSLNADAHTFVTADQTTGQLDRSLILPRITETDSVQQRLASSGFDFLKDNPSEMTYSRRIALALMPKKWYYPKLEPHAEEKEELQNAELMKDQGKEAALRMEAYPFSITKREYPSLEKAWACE